MEVFNFGVQEKELTYHVKECNIAFIVAVEKLDVKNFFTR